MLSRFWLAVVFLLWVGGTFARAEGRAASFIKFTDQDHVLVIAPHPDDESIATAGVIQQAIKAGAKVKVCLLTQGENNEFAFIVYERRIVLKPKEFLRLGDVRRKETLDAMRLLGVAPEQVVSLGYPDYGTMELFLKYWGDVKPFRSMLSRVRKVSYAQALSPGAAYIGDNLLEDLKQVVRDFRPTKVFVSHPADVNRDHRAAYLFTRVALWDLEREAAALPEIYPYIIHVNAWPLPRGYHPELYLDVPAGLEKGDITWFNQQLDSLEIGKKFDAVLEYPSQIKYAPRYLVTFVRKNEIFGDFFPIILERQMVSDAALAWVDAAWPRKSNGRIKSDKTNGFNGVSYARQGSYLVVRLLLRRVMDKDFGVSISLMGYSRSVPFAQMPKISLMFGLNGFHVKDKKKMVSSKDIVFIKKDKELVFKVPLAFLGNPERIFSSAKTVLYDLTFDETAWRILELP